jgi:hypothetical protein
MRQRLQNRFFKISEEEIASMKNAIGRTLSRADHAAEIKIAV